MCIAPVQINRMSVEVRRLEYVGECLCVAYKNALVDKMLDLGSDDRFGLTPWNEHQVCVALIKLLH